MDVSIPENHPRYRSLMARERLAELTDRGLVDRTGLIAHGRGEAFDYLMGERTTPAAAAAEEAAAAYLLRARRPVICANGNAAALDPGNLIALAREVPARLEVNVFHRRPGRVEALIAHLEEHGAEDVLGRDPDASIPGLTSERARCTREGIFDSDAVLVPIEDGDRAEALVAMGKAVIAVDLNPLSRTSRLATVSVPDELTRALEGIMEAVERLRGDEDAIGRIIAGFSNDANRRRAVGQICESLTAGLD